MIKNITDDLRQFAIANASIGKLYGLFSKFLDLCAPLINISIGSSNFNGSSLLSDAPTVMGLGRGGHILDTFPSSVSGRVNSGMTQPTEGWDDSLMWELFDNQPSLGWAESELWDAMTQLSS